MRSSTSHARVSVILLAAALLVAGATLGMAGPMGKGPGPRDPEMMLEHMTAMLDLSTEQQHQVQQTIASHRDDTQDLREKMDSAREALFDAMHAAEFDEAAIRGAAAEVDAIHTELLLSRARLFHEIREALTPDQRAKFDEMKERRRDRRGEHFHGDHGFGWGPHHGDN